MNYPPAISIITATYNRAGTLKDVYLALLGQTFTDFEWIIIDDGSTDGTCDLVAGWKNQLSIIYEYRANGGKPSAVNRGIANASGKYIVVLDSDDVPVPEAIKVFIEELGKAPVDVCSVAALTMTSEGRIIGSQLSQPSIDMTMLEAYSQFGMKGDKWLAFKADVAKQFVFPQFDTEKFSPEGIIFNRISRKGYMTRFINKPLLVHEYKSDGLTFNHYNLKEINPIGFIAYHAENIAAQDSSISSYYVKSAANIFAILILRSPKPIITAVLLTLALPIGVLKGLLDKLKLIKNNSSTRA